MSDFNPGERRMMDRIGVEDQVGLFGWVRGDAYAAGGGFLIGLVTTTILFNGIWVVAGGPIGIFIGGLAVKASPSHVDTVTWLKDITSYVLAPNRIYTASAYADSEARNEGGLKNLTPFKPDTRTEDLTGIERAWPGANAVLRSDGLIEGVIELHPPNMDFASTSETRTLQAECKRFANEELVSHEEAKLHMTTEPFEIESLQNRLEDRLTDADVRERPVFQEMIRELKDHRPDQLKSEGTQQIRFFFVVTISPWEAQTKYEGEPTPEEKLSTTPIVGPIVRRLTDDDTTGGDSLSETERHQQMIEALHDRMYAFETDFIGELDDYDSRRLSTIEQFALGARFWNGNKDAYNDIEGLVRTQAVSRETHEAPNSGRGDRYE